jgi:transposase
MCQHPVVVNLEGGPSAMEFKRIAIDTSKHVFTLHAVDASERCVLRRDLTRRQLEPYFKKLPATEVVLEACGGSHHWGRLLSAMGHRVKLIPPQYVKPFVKRGKNDRNDAEAIAEAASRPQMRFTALKAAEQQAAAMLIRVRELLVKQRTQLANAIRGHAAEFGLVVGKGIGRIGALRAAVAGSDMPEAAQQAIEVLAAQADALDARLADVEARLLRQHKACAVSQRLAAVPGIGPITALTLAATVDMRQFRSGRAFAAWLGLTPREHSSGGRQRMGGISRAGNERLRQLLVVGSTAVIRFAKPGGRNATAWLLSLLERKPRKLAAVALANKMARVVWAMMVRDEAYRRAASA